MLFRSNPQLRVFSAHLHMDEATPHLHIDFVPFTTGSKRGLDTRVSLKQALAAQGFKGGTRGDTEWNQWVHAEKEQLAAVMERHGIEWEQLGTHNEHLSVLDYKKQERTKEVKALDAAKVKIENDLAYHENRLKELAPAVENMEKLALEFSNDPDQVLPEASRIESARTYREKKAKPFAEKVVKVLRSLYSAYLDLKHSFNLLQEQYYRQARSASALSERVDELISQRELLRKEVQDYNRVKKVLGTKQINEAIEVAQRQEQLKKQRNRNLRTR